MILGTQQDEARLIARSFEDVKLNTIALQILIQISNYYVSADQPNSLP